MPRTTKPKTSDVAEAATKAVATKPAAKDAVADAKLSVAKVKEQASAVATEAADAARKAANQGKGMAVEALEEVSKLAGTAADVIDERIGTQYGDYARKAATSVSKAAEAVKNKEIDDIVADTTAYVRKRPAVAIGAVAAVGLFVTAMVRGMTRRGDDDKA